MASSKKPSFASKLGNIRGGFSDNYGDSTDEMADEIANRLFVTLEKEAQRLPSEEIPIELLDDNPYQHLARTELNAEQLEELSESIKQNGFYSTLMARIKPSDTKRYELAFGHRRREAAKLSGLTTLPVVIKKLSDEEMFNAMASENLIREDLTAIGEANIIGELYTKNNYSVEQIAKTLNKKRGWVEPRLRLFQATKDIKELVTKRPNTLSLVPTLVKVADLAERTKLINALLDESITSSDVENYVKSKNKPATTPKSATISDNQPTENIVNNITEYRNPATSDKIHNEPVLTSSELPATDYDQEEINQSSVVTALENTNEAKQHLHTHSPITNNEITFNQAFSQFTKAVLAFVDYASQTTLSDEQKQMVSALVEQLNAFQ